MSGDDGDMNMDEREQQENNKKEEEDDRDKEEEDEDGDEDEEEGDEGEAGGLKPAYSMSDLLDELDDVGVKEGVTGAELAEEAQDGLRLSQGRDVDDKGSEAEKFEEMGEVTVALSGSPTTDSGSRSQQISSEAEPQQAQEGEQDTMTQAPGTEVKDGTLVNNVEGKKSPTEPSAKGGDPATVQKIACDISGRFHVEGAQYVDQREAGVAPDSEASSLRSVSDEDHVYDDVAKKGSTLKLETAGLGTASLQEEVYENVMHGAVPDQEDEEVDDERQREASDDDYDGWSSSEFESYDESESYDSHRKKGRNGDHTLPPLPGRNKRLSQDGKSSRSSISPDIQIPDVLNKLAARLQSPKAKKEEEEEDDEVVEMMLDLDKHPPPELPPQPDGLSSLQLKRRHIVATIVESERSYISSLQRIVEDYEKPLLQANPRIISKSSIGIIFYKIRHILQCHHMFHIELAEHVRLWDDREQIGNVFTASFSKAMVFEAYSGFVNNFSIAMETAKKQARSKQAFADFLKHCLEMAPDRLSLFGLMVKPVQRFPQFIMLLQDLLKHSEKDHTDRLALQMALTELENLTHKLNETKRDSENRHDAKKIMHNLTGRHQLKSDSSRFLVRRDDMMQVVDQNGETKTKQRRLFLMNDFLVCATVGVKETDLGSVERYKYKWSVPIAEVEIVEVPLKSDYSVKSAYGKTTITSSKTEKPVPVIEVSANNPYKREIDDMLHDLPVIEQIGQLVAQLRMKYQGLSTSHVHAMTRTLQVSIQQKADVDRCVLQLAVPSKYSLSSTERLREVRRQIRSSSSPHRSSGKLQFTFQLDDAALRREWLLELQNTKLALEPRNNPGWCIPENTAVYGSKLPLFICPLPIDITKLDSKKSKSGFLKMKKRKKNLIQCAVAVVLPSTEWSGIGIQYLWVCSNNGDKGHVTVVAFHTDQPHVVESFKCTDSGIVCAEAVPGLADSEDSSPFSQDTVWMCTEDKRIQVRRVIEAERKEPLTHIPLDSMAWTLKHLDNRVFVGLHSGHLVIFNRATDGSWQFSQPETLHLGVDPVRCMLAINAEMWVGCGHCLHTVNVVRTAGNRQQITQKKHEIAAFTDGQVECMVKAGVGLMVSFRNKSTIRLLHLETLETITEINTSVVISELLEGSEMGAEMKDSLRNIHITQMLSCKGLLWIGSNVGCVLTLPLPRLEGVPQIKGRPTISYHGHMGAVKFLAPVQCGMVQQQSAVVSGPQSVDDGEDSVFLDSVTPSESGDARGFSVSHDVSGRGTLASCASKWLSSPDLRASSQLPEDDIHFLYDSLLRGLDEELDIEGLESPRHKRKSRTSTAMSLVTNNAQIIQNKFSQTVAKLSTPTTPKSKYATLPILTENSPIYENVNMNTGDLGVTPEELTHSQQSGSDTSSYQSTVSDPGSQPVPPGSQSVPPGSQPVPPGSQSVPPGSQSVPPGSYQSPRVPAKPSKTVIMVSGAEGHVNLSKPQQAGLSQEDMCLLLWQCALT